MALELLGARIEGKVAIEIEKEARTVFRKNWPEAIFYSDIREVQAEEFAGEDNGLSPGSTKLCPTKALGTGGPLWPGAALWQHTCRERKRRAWAIGASCSDG